MSQREMFQILVLMCAVLVFHKGHGQIFIGDRDGRGILWAPLPNPRDDTNIMDTQFTLISLEPDSRINDIGYDPSETMVYWCDFTKDRISRIQLDGTSREDIINTNFPANIALDLLNRKIYWTMYNDGSVGRANLNGTEVETIYASQTFVDSTIALLVDPIDEYLLWSTGVPDEVTKADLDGNSTTIVKNADLEGMINQPCADGTTRLFYFTMANTLGVINLDGSDDKTLAVVETRDYGTTLNKYGGKLIWAVSQSIEEFLIYEYDLRSAALKIHSTTVALINGSDITINPRSIRIFADVAYDELVAIEGCPDSFTINLNEGSTSIPVSWPEPKLNSWSSCPSMEFRGNVSNGGNFSAGAYDMSYMASDTAGNTDICQFTVTVLEFVVQTTPSTGSGTTSFSFSIILQTLGAVVLFIFTLD